MAIKELMKQYLVSIGFNLDNNSLSSALDAVNNGTNKISSMASKFSSSLGGAAGKIFSFTVTAAVGVSKLVDSVADADMKTQTLAKSMWMTTESYRTMSQAAESLGYSMNDLSEIAMNPELTSQFRELVQLSQEMQAQTPANIDEQLQKVRSITLEFNKWKIIGQGMVRTIVSKFLSKMGVDLDKIHISLQNVTNYLIKNMPKITDFIANIFYWIYRVAKAISNVIAFGVRIVKGTYNFMKQFPMVFKVFIATIAAIIFAMNPVLGVVLAALSAIVLLIDDYMTWKRGGKSLFGDKWATIESKAKTVKTWIETIMKGLETLFTWIYNAVKGILSMIEKMVGYLDKSQSEGSDDVDDAIDNSTLTDKSKKKVKSAKHVLDSNIFSKPYMKFLYSGLHLGKNIGDKYVKERTNNTYENLYITMNNPNKDVMDRTERLAYEVRLRNLKRQSVAK